MRPLTPRPVMASKSCTSSSDAADCVFQCALTAVDTGCSERAASVAAILNPPCCSPLNASTSVTTGLPCVMGPVLSSASDFSLRPSSRYTPPLINIPALAAAASPLTTVTGVDTTSAHGQAMTSSTSAL